MKDQISCKITTEVISDEALSVIIDAGSYAVVKASANNYFSAIVADSCGVLCRPNFYWSFIASNNSHFNSSLINSFKVSNILTISKNILPSGYMYNFSVIASCSSISGSANISIFVESSPLVVIFDRTNSSISKKFDLFIDGKGSYDPDKVSTLSYHWTCSMSNGLCPNFPSKNTLSNLTMPSSSLIGGTTLIITLTISGDTRTSSASIVFNVIAQLSTYINILFNMPKVEPSFTTIIVSQVYSSVAVTINWMQVDGTPVMIHSFTFPTMYLSPNTMAEGEVYTFMIQATQQDGPKANAYVSFLTNISPICRDGLAITPSNGRALTTVFELSIDMCSDPDLDLPLTYTFGITKNNWKYTISCAKEFNFIDCKFFEGSLTPFVNVCDQLFGCSNYITYIGVASFQSRLLSTLDQTLIPIYSIAYISTFPMDLSDITYIHNDLVSYIYNQTSINSESIDIYLSLIFEIVSRQENSLTFNVITAYLQTLMEILNNSTSEIASDNIQTIFIITENILQFGNFSMEYIQLVDSFLNTIINQYSLNMMPGTVIAKLQINDTLYYKTRLLSSNYSNFNLLLNDSTEIIVNQLQFDNDTIINLLVSVYPQINDYSSIINLNFTNSGNFKNHTLSLIPEEISVLNSSSSIQILIPYNKNITNQWACLTYNSSAWIEFDCTVIDVQNSSVLIEVTLNSFFKLADSSTLNNSSKTSPVIFIMAALVLLAIIIYAILSLVKSSDEINNNVEQLSNVRLICKYHMLFGYISQSQTLKKSDRFLIYACTQNTILTIVGAFYNYNVITLTYEGEMILIGFIAAVCSLPLYTVANLCMNSYKWYRYAFIVFYIAIFTACIILVCLLSLSQSYNVNIKWIISFFWGILFDIILEFLMSLILFLAIKEKNFDLSVTKLEIEKDLDLSYGKESKEKIKFKKTDKKLEEENKDESKKKKEELEYEYIIIQE